MFTNNLIAGAAGNQGGSFYPFPIDQSLRFNDNDTAYLSRTPASTTNRKTWTWSGWVKRGNLVGGMLFSAGLVSGTYNYHVISFSGNDRLNFNYYPDSSASAGWISTARLFRDPSAWYHIHAVWDTTQATSTDRMRLYVNGVQETVFVTETFSERYPAQNTDGFVNNSSYQHRIGQHVPGSGNSLFDGYMAEINFVDGQALEPTEFGEFKSGVWVAKEYTGSCGTNGFHLDFANGASLGADTSGNSNNWTLNNLVATDQVLDSPTNNFCTFNSVIRPYPNSDVLSEGNLRRTNSATGVTGSNWGTVNVTSGKWYYEVAIETAAALTCWIGWANDAIKAGGGTYTSAARDNAYMYMSNGNKALDSATGTAYGASYTTGDVIGVALDADNNTLTFYKNGVSQGVAFTGISTVGSWIPAVSSDPGWIPVTNFGQDSSFAGNKTAQGNTDANGVGDFYYAPPSGGYLALAASNLPDPAIDPAQDDVPADYFNTVTWTGNGTTDRDIPVGFGSDFVWIKQRSGTEHHQLFDLIRGANARLCSSGTFAEDATNTERLKAFITNGFTIGNDIAVNNSGSTYVAWNWLAGNGTSSNTDGSISTTVSANPKAGFSIISWTGNNTAGATIGHGLNSAPEMFITFRRNVGDNHPVYHSALGGTKAVHINLTDTPYTGSGYWNDTSPTSSVITLGGDSSVNWSAYNYVGYAFHSVESYSKFGSYTGNGSSSDGPFVYTGFEVAYLLIKRVDSTGSWHITDNKRDPDNVTGQIIEAETSNAEFTVPPRFDFLSNGFKLYSATNSNNASGGTYIFMAFAENPFKYANAR